MKSCKRCGSLKSHVTEVRIHNALPTRRRTCTDCGFKWKTVEIDYFEYMIWMDEKR